MNVSITNFTQGYIIKSSLKNTLSPASLMWKLLGLAERQQLKIIEGSLNYNHLTIGHQGYILTIEPSSLGTMTLQYSLASSQPNIQKSNLLVYETETQLFIYGLGQHESCWLLYRSLADIPKEYVNISFRVYQSFCGLNLKHKLGYKKLNFDNLISNDLFDGPYRYNISVVYMGPIVLLYSDGTGIYLIWSDHIQRISELAFEHFLLVGYYFDKMYMAYDCYYYAGNSFLYRNFTERHQAVYNIVYSLKATLNQNEFLIYSQNHHTLDRLETLYERAKELSARKTSYPKFGLKFISNGSVSDIYCHLAYKYKNLAQIVDIYRFDDQGDPIPIFNFENGLIGIYSLLYIGDTLVSLLPQHFNYLQEPNYESQINSLRIEDIFGLNDERFQVYYQQYHLNLIYERMTRTSLGKPKHILWAAPKINFRSQDKVDILVENPQDVDIRNENLRYIIYNMLYEQYEYIILFSWQFKEHFEKLRNLLNHGGLVYIISLNETALYNAVNPYNLDGYINELKLGHYVITYSPEDGFYINNKPVSGFESSAIPSDFKLIGFKPQMTIYGAPQTILLLNRLFCLSILVKLEPQKKENKF